MMNLWSLINSSKDNDIATELSRTARVDMQELSLVPTEKGWLLSVFGAEGDNVINVMIPSNDLKPIEITTIGGVKLTTIKTDPPRKTVWDLT